MRIAIEIKRGDDGNSVRSGIGQAIVYTASGFDFAICLFIDTSKEGNILSSVSGDKEKEFIDKLWEENNVLFGVI